jgi:2-dehydro-3-deoxygluconokinase
LMTKRFHIAALGEAMVEFNQTTAGQSQYLQGFGGDTSNAAIAAARAGAQVAYVSAVGADSFGRMLQALWTREQVDQNAVAVSADAPTGIYFVTHGAHGHEFSYRRAGSAAAQLTLSATQTATIENAQYLHLSGISLAISPHAKAQCLRAIAAAKAAGTLVCFDSNLRLKLWSLDAAKSAMLEVLALTDIFLPSLEDVVAISGLSQAADIVAWSHAHGARLVALKMGADGIVLSAAGVQTRIPALQVQALDATGAGDCFAGNFLARLALGDTAVQAALYANAAAALSVQGFGAVAPLPRPAQVRAHMGG